MSEYIPIDEAIQEVINDKNEELFIGSTISADKLVEKLPPTWHFWTIIANEDGDITFEMYTDLVDTIFCRPDGSITYMVSKNLMDFSGVKKEFLTLDSFLLSNEFNALEQRMESRNQGEGFNTNMASGTEPGIGVKWSPFISREGETVQDTAKRYQDTLCYCDKVPFSHWHDNPNMLLEG